MAIHKFVMLYKDLVNILGQDGANKIFPEYITLPDKMDKQDQICIASRVMQRMDECLDKDTIKKIRHCHTCKPSKAQLEYMMILWEKSNNIDEFLLAYGCEKQNDGTYLMSYNLPNCACPLFYKVNDYQPISISWCECCNGHTAKSLFEICGKAIKTEIIESIASGGKECKFKITVE